MAEIENKNLLGDLFEQGKKAGKLSMKDVTRTFDEIEADSEQQDKFFEMLEKAGIDIAIEEDDLLLGPRSLDDADEEFPQNVEEIPEEELVDTSDRKSVV